MSRIEIAHLREQGQDMIIVPLDRSFGTKGRQEQSQVVTELQTRSESAGLSGKVVPVWDSGGGRMAFIAPQVWHSFFQNISLQSVMAKLNRELSW